MTEILFSAKYDKYVDEIHEIRRKHDEETKYLSSEERIRRMRETNAEFNERRHEVAEERKRLTEELGEEKMKAIFHERWVKIRNQLATKLPR